MIVRRFNNAYMPSVFDALFNNESSEKNKFFTKPAYNVYENENEFVLELAAPGLEKEKFNIEVKNDMLEISFEKEEKTETKEPDFIFRGFSYGNFKRSFTLPDDVNKENISANYEAGILKVLIPKDTEAKVSRQITVS